MRNLEHLNKKGRMLNKENYGPGLIKVLKEMCSRVGADSDSMNFQEEKWFYKHTWTRDEEVDFENWLTTNKDPEINRDLGLSKAKYFRKRQVAMFMLNYGWKLTIEEETN